MKSLFFAGSVMITLLTVVNPAWAQESEVRTSLLGEKAPTKFKDLDMHLNPQIGVSSFEYSKNTGGGGQHLSGGTTAEFGGPARKLETGLLFLRTGADAVLSNGTTAHLTTSYLALPMMAKLRILSMRSQSWYAKFGFTTALRMTRDNQNATNAADVLAGAGLAGRFPLSQKMDFVVDATYNRGLLEAVRTSAGANYNQGFVVLAGVSIRI